MGEYLIHVSFDRVSFKTNKNNIARAEGLDLIRYYG
jgi:hypothetical protein